MVPTKFNTDLVDDILGFGKPKKEVLSSQTSQKEEAWAPAKKDTFIEEVKKTNEIVNKRISEKE